MAQNEPSKPYLYPHLIKNFFNPSYFDRMYILHVKSSKIRLTTIL